MSDHIVEVKNLTKRYKDLVAVNHLSFTVVQGEILGLLGPNGSGKSTTINCLLSLLQFDEGTITIFNQDMQPNAYQIKKKIGVVFQDVAVFQELTVYENLDYFCGLYIQNKKQRQSYIQEAMHLVGIEEYKKFHPKQLSGGLLRRLNIACGIVHKPSLIILDEPTVAVDPQSRNHILDGIKTLRDQGATIIYTTHYMEEVEILCDRVIIIDKGEIIASGTCDELKALTSIDEKVIVEEIEINDDVYQVICQMKDIDQVTYDSRILTIHYQKGDNHLFDLMSYFNKESIKYQRIYLQRPTLNDVFLELTGKELRD